MLALFSFLSKCFISLNDKPSWLFFQACLSKLNELIVFNKGIVSSFQKACVVQLLYSLVLKKSSNDLKFLKYSEMSIVKSKTLKQFSILP
jgi:hypothetical protein